MVDARKIIQAKNELKDKLYQDNFKMEKVKNKIKVSYVYAKTDASDFRLQKAFEMLINGEDVKKYVRERNNYKSKKVSSL